VASRAVMSEYVGFSKSSTGTLNELLTCADLIKRGWHTFRSVTPDSPCDLVAVKGEAVVRVEVKTAREYTKPSGERYVVYPKPSATQRYDVLATVLDGVVTYMPTLPVP
jgi:hypothetical protein